MNGLPSAGAAVPRMPVQLLAPVEGGIHDYAALLGQQWTAAGRPSERWTLDAVGATMQPLADRLKRLHDRSGMGSLLLLHYSGYGFERRGLCHWLADELARVRQALDGEVILSTLFHELFASGPPWRSAFWLSPIQAAIAARVGRSSHRLATTTGPYADWLRQRLGQDLPVRVRPVFSNIGEPEQRRPVHQRTRQLVVFGSPSTRQRALAGAARRVHALKALGIEQLIEVGPGRASPHVLPGLPTRFLGFAPPAELSALLQASAFGLLHYPPALLGKSGVFAAFAAHGVVALDAEDRGPDGDGLVRGRHFTTLEHPCGDADVLERIAGAAHDWYTAHALQRQAVLFLDEAG